MHLELDIRESCHPIGKDLTELRRSRGDERMFWRLWMVKRYSGTGMPQTSRSIMFSFIAKDAI